MNRILPLFFCLTILGCKSKPEVPTHLLDEEKMAKAMSFLLIAEDISFNQGLPIDSSKKILLGNYKPILLDSLGISVAQFDSSYNFYLQHPILFEEMMTICAKDLEKLVDEHQIP